MNEVFTREHIRIHLDLKDKDDYLKYIASLSVTLGVGKDKQSVYDGLIAREKEFETNLGGGIAIPHTKSSSINRPAIIVLKPENQVFWGGDYEEEVKIIISILSPEKQEDNIHIKLLASLARKLIYDDFKNGLLDAFNEEEIYKMIIEVLNN
jgi:fructose PTS system EIIA component